MDVCIGVRYKQFLPFSAVEETIKVSSLWEKKSLASAQNMLQEDE
jgi:hypothetical protein